MANIIKENGYVNIQAFMVNELHLSGNALITYAVIYGFSQDGKTWFEGSASYIAAWCQCRRETALSILKKLTESGLIEKREKFCNGVKLCDYRIAHPVRKSNIVCEEIAHTPCSKIAHPPCEESAHHTLVVDTLDPYTIENDKPPAKKPPKHRYGEYDNVLLTDDELSKLKAELPKDWQERIDRLSEYIAQKGDKYKSHYATIRAWARRNNELPKPKHEEPRKTQEENNAHLAEWFKKYTGKDYGK